MLRRELYALPALLGSTLRRRRPTTATSSRTLVDLGRRRSSSSPSGWWPSCSTSTPRNPCAPETSRERAPAEPEADPLAPVRRASCCCRFGGPEGPDEVMPFLRTRHRRAGHPGRAARGGGRALLRASAAAAPSTTRTAPCWPPCAPSWTAARSSTPLLWGNRNFDALRRPTPCARRTRARHAPGASPSSPAPTPPTPPAASTARTSPTRSAPGRRRGHRDLVVDKIRPYCNHPGLRRAPTPPGHRGAARRWRDGARRRASRLLFVTHSIPDAMDETSGPGDGEGHLYQPPAPRARRPRSPTRSTRRSGRDLDGELVFCSRSGPPTQPWLEPDVNDRLEELAAEGATRSSSSRRSASSPTTWRSSTTSTPRPPRRPSGSGCGWCGCPPSGTDEAFVAGLVDLLARARRRGPRRGRRSRSGRAATSARRCAAPGCCPNLREAKPALCGQRLMAPARPRTSDRARRARAARHRGRRRGRAAHRRRAAGRARGRRDQDHAPPTS